MENLVDEIVVRPEEMHLTKDDIARFMGYGINPVPIPLGTVIHEFLELAPAVIKPRAGFVVHKNIENTSEGFFCESTFFKTGKVISSKLVHAEYIAFFAATVGPELDTWSRKAYSSGDALLSYTIDCAGSILAELLADEAEHRIYAISSRNQCSITNRYSPGYCGWDVREQEKLFSFLPAGFCGIHLTESSLMVPIKSVSGVIGIGRNAKKTDYSCSLCNQENCFKSKYKQREKLKE